MSLPMNLAPVSLFSNRGATSELGVTAKPRMTLCKGSFAASALRISFLFTEPIEAKRIGISILFNSNASASRPPIVSALINTPSSANSTVIRASLYANCSAIASSSAFLV